MLSKYRSSIVLATLVAIGSLGTSAFADLVISVSEDGGAPTTYVDVTGPPSQLHGNSANSGTFYTADYQIEVTSASANQYSTANNAVPPGSEVQSATESITNETGSTGHVLTITVTGTGFTAPNTPPNISASSEIGGSVGSSAASTNSLTFLSTVSGSTPPGPFTPQTPSIATPSASFSDTQYQTITGLAGGFSIVQALTIELDSKGNTVNYSATTNLVSVVPEPSTMAIAGIGGLALAGYGLRRRKAKA